MIWTDWQGWILPGLTAALYVGWVILTLAKRRRS